MPFSLLIIITVEDPSDGFIALRDMLDCQNCQTLPVFQPPLIHQPFTEATAKLAREKFKINKVKSGNSDCQDLANKYIYSSLCMLP